MNLTNQANEQLAKIKRDAAGDAPASQRNKQFDVDDEDHPLNLWFVSDYEERVDMLKTNNDIWSLLCAVSDSLEEAPILHLPTIVENSKGETIIRGYNRIALHRKEEVEFRTEHLLDIVTTALLLEVVDE